MGKKPDSFFLQELRFTHFRNYHQLGISLSPGLNIIIGSNAQGKTNLLEGIHLLSTTKPLKGSFDHEVILQGKASTKLEALLYPHQTKLNIQLELQKPKKLTLNGLITKKTSEFLGRLPTVCFKSSDLTLIQGDPSSRRLFLDLQISQTDPAYFRHLSYYKHALIQRNALLKLQNPECQKEQLESWEQILASHGSAIRKLRKSFIEEIHQHSARIHEDLSCNECLSLAYLTKDPGTTENLLKEELLRSRKQDFLLKTTTKGPHRDDFSIEIDKKSARNYSSQGQQRTALLSIKFGVLSVMKSILGTTPVLLLDDIFSDLDQTRRQKLTQKISEEAGQVVITCTEKEQAGNVLTESSKIFQVTNGTIQLL